MRYKIHANVQVSLSEIQKVKPEITEDWVSNSENYNTLLNMLYEIGMDTSFKIEQEFNTHRNRFNEAVTTFRWIGEERGDTVWLKSGYASVEAVDKGLNNRILEDIYRIKGKVEV